MHDETKASEEARRERHWAAATRWRVLQETISWAEAQQTARRNTRESRMVEERAKLARLSSGQSPRAN